MNPDNPNFRTPEEEARAKELVKVSAELEEMKFHWQQATRYVMPGEFDTAESIVKHLKEKDATIIRQAEVIQTLLAGLELHFGETKFWTSPLGNTIAAMMKEPIS